MHINNNNNNNNLELRRSILELTLGQQGRVEVTNDELDRQGQQLWRSLGEAGTIGRQTEQVNKESRQLVQQVNVGVLSQLFSCFCPRSCAPRGGLTRQLAWSTSDKVAMQTLPPTVAGETTRSKVEDTKTGPDKLIAGTIKADKQHWKRTLAPAPWASKKTRSESQYLANQIWHKQMDASLRQLQTVCEETGEKLEEQSRLAQMLALYLDHGAEQALQANRLLASEKRLY